MLDIVRSLSRDKERDIQFQLNRLNALRFNPSVPIRCGPRTELAREA